MSNETRWQLDSLGFSIALEANGRDRLPYPLRYRAEFPETADEYARRRARSAQNLQQVYDDSLHRTLEILLEPHVRVEIQGFHGPRQAQTIGIHVGIADAEAVVAVQYSERDRRGGGDITLNRHPASSVAAEIVALLPRCPGGGEPRFEGRRSDLDAAVHARHPTRLSPTEKLQRFLKRPRTGTGEITVYPGFEIDARPTTDGSAFLWLDYPDDGRYLMQHHDTDNFTVIPGPTEEITRRLQARIASMSERVRPTR
ncbi:ESX secretion-associated protein EspG [Nocardia mangyaensis]|uniref:ESX secretion-associated protein EspG n=1 Tax=Nocardia mangyaensis TaxID=2213200 RepID=A0A1J0VL65_9NOCA|nr:ESX secretion-associated protein EspG [Nocardia mangyaensis]APE32749.1 ESX secretion-associated protein EspG [Nocardia mangyaensis]